MILSIDYGTKHIGLAQSDETNTIAATLASLSVPSRREPLEILLRFLRSAPKYESFVIGDPVGSTGEHTKIALEVRDFAKKLSAKTNTPHILWNETFTSHQASARFSKGDKDPRSHSEAARIILQEYLDFLHSNI